MVRKTSVKVRKPQSGYSIHVHITKTPTYYKTCTHTHTLTHAHAHTSTHPHTHIHAPNRPHTYTQSPTPHTHTPTCLHFTKQCFVDTFIIMRSTEFFTWKILFSRTINILYIRCVLPRMVKQRDTYNFSHMSRHVDWMAVLMKALPPFQELATTWHPLSSSTLPWEIHISQSSNINL